MIRRIRPLLAARRTRIGDPLPTPHPGHDRPSCVIVRDRVTGRYWRDPYLIRPTAGDPRSDWSRRRHAHVFTSSDVAAYLVATSGLADRVDLVTIEPPPETGNMFHVIGFSSCTLQVSVLGRRILAAYNYCCLQIPARTRWLSQSRSTYASPSTINLHSAFRHATSIRHRIGIGKSCRYQ